MSRVDYHVDRSICNFSLSVLERHMQGLLVRLSALHAVVAQAPIVSGRFSAAALTQFAECAPSMSSNRTGMKCLKTAFPCLSAVGMHIRRSSFFV